MALFGFGKSDAPPVAPVFSKPVDPGWVYPPKGGFFSFLDMDPEEHNLGGVGGIFLIWHAGVRPEWVYAGGTNDLASALHTAGMNSDINVYEENGGLFVAWAPVKEAYRKGVVKYLDLSFKTLVPNDGYYDDKTAVVPVKPPESPRKRPSSLFSRD
jgi:hypothetical protein